MPEGPGGKYDAETEMILRLNDCTAVMVAALDGVRGSGFSVSIKQGHKTEVLMVLPSVLRSIADQLEADTKARN